MAKITANGAHIVASFTVEKSDGSVRLRYVARSDGWILRAIIVRHEATSYSPARWNNCGLKLHGAKHHPDVIVQKLANVLANCVDEGSQWQTIINRQGV